METSIPDPVDCCLESILDPRFCGGFARSGATHQNQSCLQGTISQILRLWMNWWMNVQQQDVNQNCVGMFTLVNPKDSSRPGRSRPGLNESVKNGISKGLLQPLGCRVVTASKHHQNERFGSYSDLFLALLRTGVEPYICQACLAHLHSLHLVSAACVTSAFTHMKKEKKKIAQYT